MQKQDHGGGGADDPFAIGKPALRSEDDRLLTGAGCYVDDIALARQSYGAVVRSPHAAARILSIDAESAREMPGVLAVLTAEEMRADGLGPLPTGASVTSADGKPQIEPARMPLADGQVRHVGEPVAFVVADSQELAEEAAEAVFVEYEDLPAVTGAWEALAEEAPLVWEEAPGNASFVWETGDNAATGAAFETASHVARVSILNRRLVANPMEPRVALGEYDPGRRHYTLHTPTQGTHLIRKLIATSALKVDETHLRVITPDVGGGFGIKLYLYPEQVLVLWAARRVGRPVRWVSSRSEAFLSDAQGRDQASEAELALDDEGRFLALRVRTAANLGAYLSTLAPLITTAGGTRALTGSYAIPTVHVSVTGAFTHTVPVDAYRGAGRPEAIYVIERLVERAARDLGLDAVELRRRNLVPADAMPYTTALGQVYDSGDFARNMDDALELAEWGSFESRRMESEANGKLRGIGLSLYVEPCGGNRDQFAEVRFSSSGSVEILMGTQSNGQGHETAFAQIVADRLGVPFERITLVQGDSAQVPYGRGTSGSRSLPVGGTALVHACEKIVDKARRIAAHELEAAEADIEFSGGELRVAGTDRTMPLMDVARIAYAPGRLPDGLDMGLDETSHYMARPTTYPNGCHVCELEIDRDTGAVTILRYVVVDDFGRIVNPMLVEGQVQGGIAQGIGQALYECCIYDESSGQLLTGSFTDYAMPRADNLPGYILRTNEVPCETNPLGVKGCGEAGAIAAPPAVIAAVVDALRPLGVEDIEMPATPEVIWRAIAGAK